MQYCGVFLYNADLTEFLSYFLIVTTRFDLTMGISPTYWTKFRSVLHKLSTFPLMSEFFIDLAPTKEHKDIMVIGRLTRNLVVKLINSQRSESGPWGSIMIPRSPNHTGKGEKVPWLSGSAWRHFAFVRHHSEHWYSRHLGKSLDSTSPILGLWLTTLVVRHAPRHQAAP